MIFENTFAKILQVTEYNAVLCFWRISQLGKKRGLINNQPQSGISVLQSERQSQGVYFGTIEHAVIDFYIKYQIPF